ncbi:MAG TPA: TlpA disulfide reductase family protein [Frankiaceae bacterium]|nr:TlpA disulfide reductase family protein [Frankiaceae bacterium]
MPAPPPADRRRARRFAGLRRGVRGRSRGPARRGVAAVCGLGLAVAACTGGGSDTSSGVQRFVSGDGVVHFVDPGSREAGPALAGETLEGQPFDLGSLGAGPVVVNVWGSWCAPCKSEQPALERVAGATRSRGVRFLGINVRDSGRTAPLRHVKRYDVSYPSLYDPAARLLTRFAVAPKTIPTTYVLDADRRIAAYVFGEVREPDLTGLVERVLAERAA